jgi:nicotinamidase-related amidase
MKFGNLAHLAVDLQSRFLFPVDIGQHQRDIGGRALLPALLAFDAALHDFAIPAIWVASGDRFGRKSGLTLVGSPNADDRRLFTDTFDFPPALAATLRGAMALKSSNSAFSNPALAKRLRRMQVSALLITGLYTGQCIRETVLDAVAAGFYCRVVADLTLDNLPGDTALLRRKRLIDMFANYPQVEITDAAEIMRELRWVDSGTLEPPPPAIITTKHQSRILLHHFRQESSYCGAAMHKHATAVQAAVPVADEDLIRAFRAIEDEVT